MSAVPPSPRAVSSRLLFFGFFGGPVAWSIQLIASYALVERRCAPRVPEMAVPHLGGTEAALLIVSAAAIGVAVAAFIAAYTGWRGSAREVHGGAVHTLDAGEGRTHFMALAGVAMSALFLIACVVQLVATLLFPHCR